MSVDLYPAFEAKYVSLESGKWFIASSQYQLRQYYLHRIPELVEVGKKLGYCILVHGSTSRDLDLVAVPWVEDVADKDELAKALGEAASPGIARKSHMVWEVKPHGRKACSIPICMYDYPDPRYGVGHIDLSVMDPHWT